VAGYDVSAAKQVAAKTAFIQGAEIGNAGRGTEVPNKTDLLALTAQKPFS
jgi:hypothetical protein